MKKLLVLGIVMLTACSGVGHGDETSKTGSDESAVTSNVIPAEAAGPNLNRQFIWYVGANAMKEVVLQPTKYYVIVSNKVFTGTWTFDLATSKVTLEPGAGEEAPPELTFDVRRQDCEPDGWFPVLMNGHRKLTPYGIDPNFVEQYCHLWQPPAPQP